jgi:hypothetical protein
MDGHVTRVADDQGLALASRHPLDPLRLLRLSRSVQVTELADVVDLDADARAAQLALVGEESFE